MCLRHSGEALRDSHQSDGQKGLLGKSLTGLLKNRVHWVQSKEWEKNHQGKIFCLSWHPSLNTERTVPFHPTSWCQLSPFQVPLCPLSGAGSPGELMNMGLWLKAHWNTPADYRGLTIKPCGNKILPINNVSHMLYLHSICSLLL